MIKVRKLCLVLSAIAPLAGSGVAVLANDHSSTTADSGIAVTGSSAGQTDPSQSGKSQRFPGTGAMTAAPSTPAVTDAADDPNGFQLNFADVDIATVIGTVLGDGLGVPYSIDPQVKGTITLQATRPMGREDTLVALEAALRLQGAAMIESAGGYKITPIKDAPRRIAALRQVGQATTGFGIYIVPLQFIGAAEMEKVLQPFAPEGGVVRVDSARNLLLLAGTSQEITTLLSVINTFDVDWLAGMSFSLIPLQNVDAKTLSSELSDAFGEGRSPLAGAVRWIPMSRLNSLMLVSAQAKYLDEVETWVKRLDIPATTPGRRIYIYDVQNGKADDLAKSIASILSISVSGLSSESSTTGNGSTASSSAISRPIESMNVNRTADTSQGLSGTDVKIVPNAENNSLLILASPSEYSVIEAALQRLDSVPLQVMIEASIAEVTLNDDLRFGIQWSYQSSKGPVVLSQSSTGAINQQFPGLSFLYTGRADIQAVLNSLESLTNVRVLSAPKLVVLNNHEASLQIGDEVPIAVQSALSTASSTAPLVSTVELHDTGVILKVTPRANKSGQVLLEVAQEVSDVAPTTTSGIDSPTIQQRKISSTVSVNDGETVALGGMIRESVSRTRSGLPILSRIPLLGSLFGNTDRTKIRTELVVLITPRVIRSEVDSQEALKDLKKEFGDLKRVVPGWRKADVSQAAPTPPAP